MKRLNFLLIFLSLLNHSYGQYDMSKAFEPRTVKEDPAGLLLHVETVYDRLSPEPGLTSKQQSLLNASYKKRLAACKELLKSERVILSGDLYDYVNGCFLKVLRANPSIDQSSKLALYSDVSYNAFTLGDNLIFIHIGLLEELTSEEELAFVMSHELAHNSLMHAHIDLIAGIRKQTDSEFQRDVRSAASQSYGNVTALNELLLPGILADKLESRKQELAADSLGFVYYRSAGYQPEKVIGVFQSMARANEQKTGVPLDIPAILSLKENDPAYKKVTGYRPSNSLGAFEKDNEMEEYLRSHPYQKERLTAVARIGNFEADTSYLPARDSIYRSYRYLANGEAVQACFKEENLSMAFYYCGRMMQDFPGDVWSRNTMALLLTELSFAKYRRISGKFVDLQSPRYNLNYDKVVYFVSNLNPVEAQQLSENVLAGAPADYENSFENKLTKMIWAFQKEQYEQYELRRSLQEEDIELSVHKPFIKEIDQYYLISGKSKAK